MWKEPIAKENLGVFRDDGRVWQSIIGKAEKVFRGRLLKKKRLGFMSYV
jgi:hypothetical protein